MVRRFGLIAGIAVSSLFLIAASTRGELMKIENKSVAVTVDPAAGTFEISSKPAGRSFVKTGRFASGAGEAERARVTIPHLGSAQTIELKREKGHADAILLVDDLPFALLRTTFRNDGAEPKIFNKIHAARFELDLPSPASSLVSHGTDGLKAPDKHPGSYAYLAIADPQSRNGVVFGWLSHDRGSGVLFSGIEQNRVYVQAQTDYGRLLVAPGGEAPGELLAVGYFDDVRIGLETWADAVARYYQVQLPPQPAGYCTWYSDRYGGASDETHVIQLAKFAREHLGDFGFGFVQIDDKWQIGARRQGPAKDFTGVNPKGPYPSGMKKAADQIKALGLTPGIWFMPFAGDHENPLFKPHLDWFVKDTEGKLFETRWGGTSLDMTHPGARDHLKRLVNLAAHEWGYTYFKMDGLYTGTATDQVYVNHGYKEKDRIGDAVFHDPNITNIEAFRSGLKLVREVAGKDVFFLGCTVSQNMRSFGGSFGLVDAMRIGPDNNSSWGSLQRGPQTGGWRYFLHGRVWYNDPDPVYVRNSMPTNHARLIASWVSLSGQLYANSDWLPDVAAERIEILKRTMAPHHQRPRPVDFLEQDMPRIWHVSDTRRANRIDVVGLYNWSSKAAEIKATAEHIGLPKADSYVAFDYWDNTFLPPFKDTLAVTVPKQSSRVLAIRPMVNRPQVVSTARHVTQGIVDELAETWDASSSTLAGQCNVIGNDPYELRLVTLAGADTCWQIEQVTLDSPGTVQVRQTGALARIGFEPPRSGSVKWRIKFRPEPVKVEPAVVAISNLQARTEGLRAVELSWQSSGGDGIAYEVRRDDGPAQLVAAPRFVDDAVEKGKQYSYAVSAVDYLGNRSSPLVARVQVPAKLDPGPVPPRPKVALATLKPAQVRPNNLEIATTASGIQLPIGARVVYDRDRSYSRFVAVVSVEPAQRSGASAIVRVINDDGEDIASQNTIAETAEMDSADTPVWHLDVELPDNCRRVHLVVERADDGRGALNVSLREAGFVTR